MIRSPFLFLSLVAFSALAATSLLMPSHLFPHQFAILFAKYHWFDDVAHSTLFFALYMFMHWSLTLQKWNIAVALTVVAVLSELAQGWLSVSRVASVPDAISDMVGIFFGLLLVNALYNEQNSRRGGCLYMMP